MTMQVKRPLNARLRVLLMTSAAVVASLSVTGVIAGETNQRLRHVAAADSAQSNTTKLAEQAKEALAQNHPDVAAIFLRSALAADPNNASLRLQLGIALFRAGDLPSAESELRTARSKGAREADVLPVLFGVMLARAEDQQVIEQFPAPAEGDHSAVASIILRARASALSKKGWFKEAATALDRALSFDSSVVNLLARAQVAQIMGEKGLALQMVDSALAKSPKEASALMLKIDLLLQDNKQDQALDVANQLVNDYPQNPQGLVSRARIYLQMKDNPKALADIDAGLKIAPRMALAIYYKALVLAQSNDIQQAWELTQDLPPAFVNSRPEIALGIGEIATKAGHVEIGTSMLASAVANFPNSVDARVQLAAHYLQSMDPSRALETLQPLSASLDPRVVLMLAQAYDMQHQYGKSVEYLEKASQAGVGGDTLKRRIALTNLQGGNVDTAISELEKLNAANPADPQVAGPLIGAYLRRNEYDKAQEVTEKLVSAAPNQPFGPYFQGQLFLRKGDLDSAVSAFSRAIEHDGKFVAALYERASALAARGDLKAAEQDIRSILSVDPNNMMAEISLAEMELRSGQKDGAIAALKKAVAGHPKEPLPMLTLASLDMQASRFDDATAVVNDFLSKVPDSPQALAMQGEILLASGKIGQAVNTFSDLARAQPNSPQIQMLLASARSKAGQTKDAADAYRRALDLSPSLHAAHLGLIQLALADKDDNGALAAAQDYAEKEPGPLSADTLASTYVALKRIDDAVNVLLRAQEKYPNSATLVSLTALMRAQGAGAKADAMLKDWIDKHPGDVNVRMAYAGAQLRTDPATAEGQYRAVLQVQPYNAAALNNMAWLLQKRDPRQALSYAERVSKMAPASGPVLDTLGWTKWLMNDKGEALAILEKAHTNDTANGDITYHLVLALDGNGRHEDAKKLLSDLLTSNRQFDERKQAESLGAKWQ